MATLAGIAHQRVVADARHGLVSVTRLRASLVRAPAAVDATMSAATPLPRVRQPSTGATRPPDRARASTRTGRGAPGPCRRPRQPACREQSQRPRQRRSKRSTRSHGQPHAGRRQRLGRPTFADGVFAGVRDASIRTTAATPPTVTAAVASTDAVANPFETIATPAALPAVLAAAAPPVAAPPVAAAFAAPPVADRLLPRHRRPIATAASTARASTISGRRRRQDGNDRAHLHLASPNRVANAEHDAQSRRWARTRRPRRTRRSPSEIARQTSAHAITRPSAHSAIPRRASKIACLAAPGEISSATAISSCDSPLSSRITSALRARSGSDARSPSSISRRARAPA